MKLTVRQLKRVISEAINRKKPTSMKVAYVKGLSINDIVDLLSKPRGFNKKKYDDLLSVFEMFGVDSSRLTNLGDELIAARKQLKNDIRVGDKHSEKLSISFLKNLRRSLTVIISNAKKRM